MLESQCDEKGRGGGGKRGKKKELNFEKEHTMS